MVEQGDECIEGARANLDAAVPVLTRDPSSTAADLVNRSEAKPQLEKLSDKELLIAAARAALITVTLVEREFHAHAPELVQARPAETAVLIQALAAQCKAATGALLHSLAPELPKD